MAGYLGAIPVPQATQHRESFTATSGQTTFATAGYTVGFLDVYLNGSHLSPADFTATNGSDVVLASGASADDVCDIISYTAFEINSQTFTGTTTLDGAVVINESSADVDFRVESNGNANMLFVNGGNDRVGIGTNNPSNLLDVVGASGSISAMRVANPDVGLLLSAYTDSFAEIRVQTDHPLVFKTNGNSEKMRVTSAGNVLVGKTSGSISATGTAIYGGSNEGLIESTRDGANVMKLNRLSSDGDIAVFAKAGTTVGSIGSTSDGGIYIQSQEADTTNSASSLVTIRDSTGGDRVLLGGSGIYGFIGDRSGSGAGISFVSTAIRPFSTDDMANKDNFFDMGIASARWDDIYASNGTIQTSDANEKQDIASLTPAEMLVAKRISALFKTFRWKDKVAEKGDNARTHTGIIAQDVQAAFTAESLDAGDYSLFISSTWWEHDVDVPAVEAADAVDAVYREVTDSDGMVTNELVTPAKEAVEAVDAYTRTDTYDTEDEAPAGATSKTRMGIRYPELLSFVAAYNEQRFAAIETRLTALEGE
jgi:hypothetical protein